MGGNTESKAGGSSSCDKFLSGIVADSKNTQFGVGSLLGGASDCRSAEHEYRRCSQQLPNPESRAVRGSAQALPCSLDDAASYVVYIATYSAEVHIIH